MPPSPALRRLPLVPTALASVLANVGIVLTGGIVRVTASGLGCPQWPSCDGTSVVPVGEVSGWHAGIEFSNRLLTFVLLVVAIAVVVAARAHAPGRRDIQRLAWAQPLGIVAQAVLGGITVLTDLSPLVVAAHYLLSTVLIAAAVVLHERARDLYRPLPEPAPIAQALRRLAILVPTVAAVVLVLGTLVTASGPHAGDPGTPRLGLDIRTIAVAHADAVWLLVGLTVALLAVVLAAPEPRLRGPVLALLAIELAQGGIGYLQYALGIPAGLVALHLLGSASVWVAALRVAIAARRLVHGPAAADHTSVPAPLESVG